MNAFGMNSRVKTVIVLLAATLLAGCASSGSSMAVRGEGFKRTDADYITAVEQMAKKRGVRVYWVNPPQELGKDYSAQVR
jgi:hypothetical protein